MKQKLFYGVPDVASLPEIRRHFSGVVVNEENLLHHSVIFLREIGFPVYVNGIMSTCYNIPNRWESNVCGFRVSTRTALPCHRHHLPVSLWRSEFALFDGHFPTGQDYLTALSAKMAVRLFDFTSEKQIADANRLSALQMQQIALFPDLKVLVLHCLSPRQLLMPNFGAMIEDAASCNEALLSRAAFVFLGATI